MALKVRDVLGHITQVLYGNSLSEHLDSIGLLNRAGQHLLSMHDWPWLVRTQASIDVVAGQSWATLPSDFGTVLAVQSASTGVNIELTSPKAILDLQMQGTSDAGTYTAAIVYSTPTPTTRTAPRLELYPVPSAAASGVFKLFYRAGWVQVSDDGDYIPIPDQLGIEALYIAIVRAFVEGYEDDDSDTVQERLATVASGPLYAAALHASNSVQTFFGPLRGRRSGFSDGVQRTGTTVADLL